MKSTVIIIHRIALGICDLFIVFVISKTNYYHTQQLVFVGMFLSKFAND